MAGDILFPVGMTILGIMGLFAVGAGIYNAGRIDGQNAQYYAWRAALVDSPASIASIRSEVLLEREIQRIKDSRK